MRAWLTAPGGRAQRHSGCLVVAIPPGWSGCGLFGFDGYFQAEFLQLGDEALLLGFRAVSAPHPNRLVLVAGPEITVRPVAARALARRDAR